MYNWFIVWAAPQAIEKAKKKMLEARRRVFRPQISLSFDMIIIKAVEIPHPSVLYLAILKKTLDDLLQLSVKRYARTSHPD